MQRFEQGTFNKKIVDWTIKKYLPFSFFEDECTQELFQYIRPEIKLPLRNELKSQINIRFTEMQNALIIIFENNSSKISFTIDGWTSVAHRSYFGITAHFINDKWDLESLVIDFVPSNGFHTGCDIAKKFQESLQKYKIENKLQAITVDNTSANTKFMEELAKRIKDFDSKEQHYRCYAHILNLGAQAMLKILKVEDNVEDKEDDQVLAF